MANYGVVSQPIDELLSPKKGFLVPPFQRRYSWKEDQISQLIDDVFEASPNDELPYFLGSIVLASSDDAGDNSKRSLVLDGQQRLTTISLMIAVLIQKMGKAAFLRRTYTNRPYALTREG